jgi:hypothetical protein
MMPLPPVSGWIIDFRTARSIFASGSNARISHCVELCGAGKLVACHYEEVQFKSDPKLKPAFLDGKNCIVVPDEDVMKRCISIAKTPLKKKRLIGTDAPLFIAAFAAANSFGVISDHRSPSFSTVSDICEHYGIPALTADQYFEAAL